MKIYTYKNDEKAVFINNEKVIITSDVAFKLELFANVIADLDNESAYKSMLDEDILKFSEKYQVETKEADGCRIDFLVKNKIALSAYITEDGEDMEKLDNDNMEFAYSDFNAFLNS